MADLEHLQKDFSGGEVGPRVLMRDDLAMHGKSVSVMENFIPTPQGTAVRSPGSQYVNVEVGADNARIFPYLSPSNEEALVIITPTTYEEDGETVLVAGTVRVLTDIPVLGAETVALSGAQVQAGVPVTVWRQIKTNANFTEGFADWIQFPLAYVNQQGATYGWEFIPPGQVTCQAVTSNTPTSEEPNPSYIKGSAVLVEDTLGLKIRLIMKYLENFNTIGNPDKVTINLGTTDGASDIWQDIWLPEVGETYQPDVVSISTSLSAGTTVYMTIEILAVAQVGQTKSLPLFSVSFFGLYSQETVEIEEGPVTGIPPWTSDQLNKVQFVQSPYPGVLEPGKELVFTQASWPVQELIFDTSGTPGYFLRDKLFVNDASEAYTPWPAGNNPACCASFYGRLMLGGAQEDPLPGDPSGSATETVWGTHVGDWNLFDPDTEVDPDDSIEFTAIYRSPIQWLYGQKGLIVGARDMEYISSADGIYSPGDLGVAMQSVHGSASVQPVGLGDRVLFAAEGGTKIRSLEFQNEAQGWISPDMTMLHPQLFVRGVRRMVHLHNPHQMAVCVMNSGQVAMLHLDPTIGSMGWSRLNFNANVIDAAVIPDDTGFEVLYLLVERTLNGVKKLVLESMPQWRDIGIFTYMNSYSIFIPDVPTNIITGMEHLANVLVQVVGDGNYLGTHKVSPTGTIELLNQIGNPIDVTVAEVGLAMSANLQTLPLITQDPTSFKRYTKIYVRVIGSLRPIINGERPADRDPATLQNVSQGLDLIRDDEIAHLGTDAWQLVTITETIPYRLEVIGIYGSGTQNSI
jgi:hypothetical protein